MIDQGEARSSDSSNTIKIAIAHVPLFVTQVANAQPKLM
jgi:hypothetical protein